MEDRFFLPPLPPGEGRGEGPPISRRPSVTPPHPNPLPEGEGTGSRNVPAASDVRGSRRRTPSVSVHFLSAPQYPPYGLPALLLVLALLARPPALAAQDATAPRPASPATDAAVRR